MNRKTIATTRLPSGELLIGAGDSLFCSEPAFSTRMMYCSSSGLKSPMI